MEDTSGNIQLFYRLYTSNYYGTFQADNNSVYHLDLSNSIDTLFLNDYITIPPGGENRIQDYKFWNNDPSKFIFCGYKSVQDPVATIQRFDESMPSYYGMGSVDNIFISRQNDSLVFAGGFQFTILSTDGGRSWDYPESMLNKQLISLSPFNDSILFLQEDNKLLRTTNRGISISVIDTNRNENISFLYDVDKQHIYRTAYSNLQYSLLASDDAGNAFSWVKRYSSSNKIFINTDPNQPGVIYLACGLNIYYSADFGASFSLYRTLNRKIIGIYVSKENSVYAATKYDLYLIKQSLGRTRDTLETIKHLPVDIKVLRLFPLKVGNEWTYENSVEMYKSRSKIKVIKDTIISGMRYFKLTNGYFRIDSLYGRICRYISGDFVFYDFSASEIGDTVLFNQYNGYTEGWFLDNRTEFNKWGINWDEYQYDYIIPTSGYKLSTFIKDVGLYKDEGGEILYSSSVLVGFVKNGLVYGDTALVGVNEDRENIPGGYSLSQNFPNPFNPSTIIKYSIPKTLFVTLKIYNILGKEVETLLNEEKPAGTYRLEFSVKNGSGQYNMNNRLLSSGIYFYRLRAGDYIQTKKMIYLK